MEEKNLSGTESLQIIEQMIGRAKAEEKDNGMGWILWGWMLFVASIAHYILIVSNAPNRAVVWNIFAVLAGGWLLYSAVVKPLFLKPASHVTTYTNELVNRFGLAFFISLVIMVTGNALTGLNESGVNFGYLLLLYGFWMYIHGSAFRDNLLRAGAAVNWAGALVIFLYYKDLGKYVLLVHAFCVALGYLVPGHIAQRRFSQEKKGEPVK